MTKTHYDTLGIAKDATQAEIRRAFRKKASHFHPDRGGDPKVMAEINQAYECLGDAARRATYDETGHDDSQGPTLEETGQSVFMQHLDGQLNAGNAVNILARTRQSILTQISEDTGKRNNLASALAALKKDRNRLRRKSKGINAFHAVMDKRIEHVEAGLVEGARKIEELNLALRMVDEYEDLMENGSMLARLTAQQGVKVK